MFSSISLCCLETELIESLKQAYDFRWSNYWNHIICFNLRKFLYSSCCGKCETENFNTLKKTHKKNQQRILTSKTNTKQF